MVSIVCMYACMYGMYVCMLCDARYVCMRVCMCVNVCTHGMCVWMNVLCVRTQCMSVCMLRMYVCKLCCVALSYVICVRMVCMCVCV